MADKIKMADIARIAGVGKSTVSRYFNKGYVKKETREKIKMVIEKYDYKPDPIARTLKERRTYQIGVITPTFESKSVSRILMAIDNEVRLNGYTPFITNTNHTNSKEVTSMEDFGRMNVEGIIVLATYITDEHLRVVEKLDIPVVFVAQEVENLVYVTTDDYNAGFDMGSYIAKMNHKSICYVGVSELDKAVGVSRKLGVLDGLTENGVTDIDYVETDFSFTNSRKAVREYLEKKIPNAMICATDNIAFGAFKEINELGLDIPRDISLAGFGGYDISDVITPSLCTVRFDYSKEGVIASKNILSMICGEDVQSCKVGYEFIEGRSVTFKR